MMGYGQGGLEPLSWWHTKGGWVFVGIVMLALVDGLLLLMLIPALTGNVEGYFIHMGAGTARTMGKIAVAIKLALCCVAVFYATGIYPSLFGHAPRLKSSAAVSFLNGFLGGIIFGPLFCASLTRGTKGISHIVFTILMFIIFIIIFFDIYYGINQFFLTHTDIRLYW